MVADPARMTERLEREMMFRLARRRKRGETPVQEYSFDLGRRDTAYGVNAFLCGTYRPDQVFHSKVGEGLKTDLFGTLSPDHPSSIRNAIVL